MIFKENRKLTVACLLLVSVPFLYMASRSSDRWYLPLIQKLHPDRDTVMKNINAAIDAKDWPVAKALAQRALHRFPADEGLKDASERINREFRNAQNQQERERKINRLIALANAQSDADLQNIYSNTLHDYSSGVVYAVRHYELVGRVGREAEEGLFDVFPKSAAQQTEIFETLDDNRSLDPEADDARLQHVYYNFYRYAAQLAEKDTAHLSAFLRALNRFNKGDNGKEEPMLCRFASEIYENNPQAYQSVADSLDKETKQQALNCRMNAAWPKPSRSPSDPGDTWEPYEFRSLGIRLLFENIKGVENYYQLSSNGNWLEQHRPSDDRTYGGPQIIQVLSKPASESIEETIRKNFIPPGTECKVTPYKAPVHDPNKVFLQIRATGKLEQQLAQSDGKPGCDEFGQYTGCEDPIIYFEYHPLESKTKYAFVVFGGDAHPLFDEKSIQLFDR